MHAAAGRAEGGRDPHHNPHPPGAAGENADAPPPPLSPLPLRGQILQGGRVLCSCLFCFLKIKVSLPRVPSSHPSQHDAVKMPGARHARGWRLPHRAIGHPAAALSSVPAESSGVTSVPRRSEAVDGSTPPRSVLSERCNMSPGETTLAALFGLLGGGGGVDRDGTLTDRY